MYSRNTSRKTAPSQARYTTVSDDVLTSGRLSPAQLAVYIHLRSFCSYTGDRTRGAHPSVTLLSSRTNLCRRKVISVRNELRAMGLIAWARGTGSCRYVVQECFREGAQDAHQETSESAPHAPQGCTTCTSEGAQDAHKQKTDTDRHLTKRPRARVRRQHVTNLHVTTDDQRQASSKPPHPAALPDAERIRIHRAAIDSVPDGAGPRWRARHIERETIRLTQEWSTSHPETSA